MDKEIIKKAYRDSFARDIDDNEVEEIISCLLSHMRSELEQLADFSDASFKRYMGDMRNNLTFSPGCIFSEIDRAIKKFGIEEFKKSSKYKVLREMEVAARLCLARYKDKGERFTIKPQDNPDTVLVGLSKKPNGEKYIKAYRLEIMTVPEIVKGEFDGDLSESLTNFIKDKKFEKRYELSGLMISMDFNEKNLDIKSISDRLACIKNNPYDRIWLTSIVSEDGTTYMVAQIYPYFSRIDYNFIKEPYLVY